MSDHAFDDPRWDNYLPNVERFTGWLEEQVWRGDAVGDLARDVDNDPDWPADDDRNLMALRTYLDPLYHPFGGSALDGGLLSVLDLAWAEFQGEDATVEVTS